MDGLTIDDVYLSIVCLYIVNDRFYAGGGVDVVEVVVVVVPAADVRDAYVILVLQPLFSLPSSARTCTAISTNFSSPVSIRSRLLTADSSVIHFRNNGYGRYSMCRCIGCSIKAA